MMRIAVTGSMGQVATLLIERAGRAHRWRSRKGTLRALRLSRRAALFDAYMQPHVLALRAGVDVRTVRLKRG